MLAQVDELRAAEPGGHRLGHEDLATVGDGCHAFALDQGGPEPPLAPMLDGAAVDRHPGGTTARDAPLGAEKRGLRGDRGGDRFVHLVERRGTAPVERRDHRAPVVVERGADEAVVVGQVRLHRLGSVGPAG